MECSPGEAVMVGDDVRDDVGGAQAAGLGGILVQTGKYSTVTTACLEIRKPLC